MNVSRVPAILLALVLQVAPVVRVAQTLQAGVPSAFAIVLRLAAAATAALGGVHAVSGASTTITSATSATGTNGVAFTYRITTGPQSANTFSATPLPTGLACSATTGRITGTPTQTGVWTVLLTASDSGIASRTVTTNLALTIVSSGGGGTAPSITTQPATQTVNAGANVSFSVAATGTATLTYQWKKNGTVISGATASTLSLTAVTSADAATYSVVVSNSVGTATSSGAVLTVNTAPSITTQPATQTVNAGANVSFSVVATGTATLTYQWKKNGTVISGATASTLSLTAVTSADAATYSVVVSNSVGTATSSGAVLTVNTAPSITTQPSTQTVNAGANVTFSVVATGTATLTYQWSKNGTPIGGATASTLSLNGVTSADAATYSVVVSNSVGTATSTGAVLTVNTAPSITSQPSGQTVTAGANVSFSVVATGTATLTYQWKKDGVVLGGATSATLSLTSVSSGNAGTYTVVVSNSVGTATSTGAVLTVNAAPVAPSITTQPSTQTVNAGANVSFSVVATGTATLTYQWSKNGTPIGGATASSLSLTAVTSADAATYSVVVSNSVGTATSSGAVLTVNTAPSITSQPSSQVVNAGANVSFSVAASGTAPFTYQWSKGGTPIGGATASTLSLSSVSASDAGSYTVVVGNVAGSATSSSAVLTVNTGPVVTVPPASQSVTNGGAVSFSVTVTGTAPFTYQWSKDATPIVGETASTLTLSPVSTGDAGTYAVTVSNVVGSVTSAGAVLTVDTPPTVTTQPRSTVALTGGNPTFTVVATGTGPLGYQWFYNGVEIGGATSNVLALTSVTTNNNGAYFVVVSNVAGTATSTHALLAVRPPPQPPTIVTNPLTLIRYVGDSAGFFVVATGTGPLHYQWQFKGTNLPGATSSSLTLSNVSLLDAGAYGVTVTNAVGSATSRPAWLLVRVAPSPPPADTAAPAAPNAAPIPVAAVTGQDALGTNFNRVLLFPPGRSELQVTLDASASHDPEHDPLRFVWQADPGDGRLQPFATGALTTNTLVAGDYHLVLTVSDPTHQASIRLDLSAVTASDFTLALLQDLEDLNLPELQASAARDPLLGVVQALQGDDPAVAHSHLDDAVSALDELLQSGSISAPHQGRLMEGVRRLLTVIP